MKHKWGPHHKVGSKGMRGDFFLLFHVPVGVTDFNNSNVLILIFLVIVSFLLKT